jgi:hypothetical protein
VSARVKNVSNKCCEKNKNKIVRGNKHFPPMFEVSK